MNVKSVRWIVLLVLAALLLAACTPAAPATETAAPTEEADVTEEAEGEATEEAEATEEGTAEPTEAPTAEPTEAAEEATGDPLRIGVIQDLSGGLLLFGNEALNGFNLGIEYASGGDMIVAGRPIEILVRDDAGNAENAAAAARELIEAEGVEILFGTSSSANALQIQQIAAENDVLYFAGPAAAPGLTGESFTENTFRICRNAAQDSLVIMPWAIENVGQNYAILAEDYAFGQQTAGGFQAQIEAFGGSVVPNGAPIFAPTGTTDFTPYIQQILDSEPDGLVLVWADNTSATLLFEQLESQGVTGQIPFITGFSSNDLTALLDPGFVGSTGLIVYHYSLPDTEANDWLVEQHLAQYDGSYPDLFTECGFATAQGVVEGLLATEGDTSTDAMIPALEGLSFDGPKGTYTIRPEDHQALAPGYVVQLVSIDDPDEAYFELVNERPADEIAPPCLAPDRCPES